jgi:cystathionine gamma-lyase
MEPEDDRNGAKWGLGTRAVHAGLPAPERGQPFLPGPSLAAPVHLAGEALHAGYGRYANATWTLLEDAIGGLEGGETLVFASGMAAVSAVALTLCGPGSVLVAPSDGYPGIRGIANDRLAPIGAEVRFVGSDTGAILAALPGATVVWVETPSNPNLDIVDIAAVADAARAAGAITVVDNSLATPLGQQPLALGADLSVAAATKSLSGHSDLLLGYAACRSAETAARLRAWRDQTGAIAGPFEAWLAHRSLATLELRLERQSENAAAIASQLQARGDAGIVRHPGSDPVARRQMRRFGPLVGFDLGDADRAQRFLAGCELVAEATSFGGIHTTAERRARWGTDAVGEGFIRFSAGCEDTEDLVADVAKALDSL